MSAPFCDWCDQDATVQVASLNVWVRACTEHGPQFVAVITRDKLRVLRSDLYAAEKGLPSREVMVEALTRASWCINPGDLHENLLHTYERLLRS